MPLIQPKWPIEQATLYVVSYYATNAESAEPVETYNIMSDYNAAIEKAKELITDNANVGVCTVQPVNTAIVFPAVEWVDF